MKSVLIAILILTAGVLGTCVWWQNRRIIELEGIVARAADEEPALQRRMTDAEERFAAVAKSRAELDAELQNVRSQLGTGPVARPDVPRVSTTASTGTTGAAYGVDNPAVQQVMVVALKSGLDQRYGGLFRQLKLSTAEMEKMKSLLVERQMTTLDVARAAQMQGMTSATTPDELLALVQKVQDGADNNIRELLGEQRFERYQHYNENVASFAVRDLIERRLSYTNTPLQDSQYESLLRVLAETTQPVSGEGGPSRIGLNAYAQGFAGANPFAGVPQRLIADETIARAHDVLTPAQTEVLLQIQAEQESQARLLEIVRSPHGVTSTNVVPGPGSQSPNP